MENKSLQLPQLTVLNKFILARWCYSIGQPIISDAEYNVLSEVMHKTMPDNPYCKRSWSSDPCPTELLNSINRPEWIKAIILADKTESIPSLNTDTEVKELLGNWTGDGTLSMKHDGWNIQPNYYNGHLVNIQTRGRKTDAMSANAVSRLIPQTIPVNGSVRIPGELTVNKHNFATCQELFNNVSPRSAVSSVLSRPDYVHLLDFHAFDIDGCGYEGNKFDTLWAWGFQTPAYYIVHNYDDILTAFSKLSEIKDNYLSPTDGAVFDSLGLRRAIRLLAWEEPIYRTYVTGYWEQWKAYRISPSITIYPILRGGTTQRRINMTNWQRILDNDLQPGSPVAFRIASNATADFDADATKLLRMEYAGRWEEFASMVRMDEEVKALQWKRLSS